MISKLKVAHHIKKIQENLRLTIVNQDINSKETTLKLLVDNLLLRYKEYQLEPKEKLIETVREVIMEIYNQSLNSSTATNMSLNQTLINQYNKSSSKRQRPIDKDDIEVDVSLSPTSIPIQANLSHQLESAILETLDNTKNVNTATTTTNTTIATKKRNKNNYYNELNKDAKDKNHEKQQQQQQTILSSNFMLNRPKIRLSDLAGIDTILEQIQELVFYPIKYPELYSHLGIIPPTGILFHGPSGCGKTMLANAIAGELGLPYFKASGPELVGGTSGESEERIRLVFENAAAYSPSVLFIDGIDVIAGKKDVSQRGMERRIIAQLFDSIDYITSLSSKPPKEDIISSDNTSTQQTSSDEVTGTITEKFVSEDVSEPKIVILIAATNKPDLLDPGVRGRFSREIGLPVPDSNARSKILELMSSQMRISLDTDFITLGKLTPGFVGADLQSLTREAGMLAVSRIVKSSKENNLIIPNSCNIEEEISSSNINEEQDKKIENPPLKQCDIDIPVINKEVYVEMNDFILASKSIQPSAKREGFAIAPDVTWNDIGALAEVREELLHNVLEPIAHPERFKRLGLEIPAGVLFFGPPGCGKTLLAKALANQSGANFISVKGPELLSMYVGESESRVRQVFARARSSAPCVIFFDELDALCPKRGSGMEGMASNSGSSSNGVSDRVVNQLLTELDGLETRRDVYIIAATNRLELIDDAMLRPGRLGKLLYVPLPSAIDRISILKALTKKVNIDIKSNQEKSNDDGVKLEDIALDSRAEGFSGADLAALVREAGLAVIREISYLYRNSSDNNTTNIVINEILGDNYHTINPNNSIHNNELINKEYMNDEIQTIKARHFEAAFNRVHPSVAEKDRIRYELINSYIKNGMGAIQALQTVANELYGNYSNRN